MSTFDYRRRLETKELGMLLGAAGGAAAAVAVTIFYFGRIWLQRVPIGPRAEEGRPKLPADPVLARLTALSGAGKPS